METRFITDEETGSYIPNPDHEQNHTNKWASRWKIESVAGNASPLNTLGNEQQCEDFEITTFGGSNLHTKGDDLNYPENTYSESPDYSLGDNTWDLVGFIPTPEEGVYRFGEKVKLVEDKLFVTNPSIPSPVCYAYVKTVNEHGCETWKYTHNITEDAVNGVNFEKTLSEEFNTIKLEVTENFIDLGICPVGDDYDKWAYQFDKDLTASDFTDENRENIVKGTIVDKCNFECNDTQDNKFYYRPKKLKNTPIGHLECNYGSELNISSLLKNDFLNSTTPKFYSKAKLENSYTSGLSENSTGISWKNFREGVSFIFPDVESGTQASFMTIYSDDAKNNDGTYDPLRTLGRLGHKRL